jgi:hypothetical protein
MNILKDNEQRHQWLRQEAHLAHQSASIERLENAVECQRKAITCQNFNRRNGHRGVRNFPKTRNWKTGNFKKNKFNKGRKTRNQIITDENEGKKILTNFHSIK